MRKTGAETSTAQRKSQIASTSNEPQIAQYQPVNCRIASCLTKNQKGKNFAEPPLATKQDGKEYVSATPQAGVLRRIITA